MDILHGNAKDLTKQEFGKLTALEPTQKRKAGSVVWLCVCSCGNKCFVDAGHLQSKSIKSCGCLAKKHGMSKTLIYKIWQSMIDRCENPKCKAFKDYGGRGIKVCKRWHTFENFYADVGDRPKGKSLDRWPDNDGNYELTNFRWATHREQQLNCRPRSSGYNRQRWFYGHGPNNEMILENNQRHVSKIFGLCFQNISKCLHGERPHCKGWTFEWLPDQETN